MYLLHIKAYHLQKILHLKPYRFPWSLSNLNLWPESQHLLMTEAINFLIGNKREVTAVGKKRKLPAQYALLRSVSIPQAC